MGNGSVQECETKAQMTVLLSQENLFNKVQYKGIEKGIEIWKNGSIRDAIIWIISDIYCCHICVTNLHCI